MSAKRTPDDEWTCNVKEPESMTVGELNAVVKALREREYQTALKTQDAVLSYRKHCGPRAVECAEQDLLGEALALASRVHKHGCTGVADVGSDCGKCFSCQARALLAKAGGK